MIRSTFAGFEIARTGLAVSQKGLDVTGHNVANVDTPGYTRQRLITTAYEPYSAISQFKPLTVGLVGGGTNVVVLDQIRSGFLDRQYRTEQSLHSYWSTRTQGLTYIESQFEGPDVTSLTGSVDELFRSFSILSTNSSDREQRKVVQQMALNLTTNLNTLYDRLVTQQRSQNEAVNTVVKDINAIAKNIAALNESIYSFELTGGQPANDLRDKRNLLIDQLSAYADIEYYEENGKLTVTLAGEKLVSHKTVNEIVTDHTTATDPITGEPIYELSWKMADGTTEVFNLDPLNGGLKSGQLRANLDLRDSVDEETPGIPYFIEQLNILARALVQNINDVHKQGWTYPVGGAASATGVNFFDDFGDVASVNAGNISLSQEVLDSEYNIAASDVQIILSHSDPDMIQSGNQIIAQQLYELFNRTDLSTVDFAGNTVAVGSFEGFIDGILADLSIKLNFSQKMEDRESTLMLSADTQRTSIAGVSLDEEMTNLIKYQHAYSGSSRVITTMDEALDKLINGTGVVGR